MLLHDGYGNGDSETQLMFPVYVLKEMLGL